MTTSPRYHGIEEEGLRAEDWIALTRARRKSYLKLARKINRTCPLECGRVLDFGCGDGTLLSLMADRWPETVSMVGVEINEDLAGWADRNRARENLAFRFVQDIEGDIERDYYDLVLSTFVCHHWEDPKEFIRIILGFLKPGGCAYVEDINPSSLYSLIHASRLFYVLFRPSREDFQGYRHSRDHAHHPQHLDRALDEIDDIAYRTRCRRGRVMIHIRKGREGS